MIVLDKATGYTVAYLTMSRYSREHDTQILSAINEALEKYGRDQTANGKEDQEVLKTLGTLALVDFHLNAKDSNGNTYLCRAADKIKTSGTKIYPSDFLQPSQLKKVDSVKDGAKCKTYGSPFSDGPLIVMRYNKRVDAIGADNKKVTNIIDTSVVFDLSEADIIFGFESEQFNTIKVLRMLPQALEDIPIEVGKRYRYVEADVDPTSTNDTSFDTRGPVTEILVCSPPLEFPPQHHPHYSALMTQGPLQLDETFVRMQRFLQVGNTTYETQLKQEKFDAKIALRNQKLQRFQQELLR